MTERRTTNLGLIDFFTDYRGYGKSSRSRLSALGEHTKQWKRLLKATFDTHCETGFMR